MKIDYKDDFLVKICTDKNVLHVGATDSPYHLEKVKKNRLLHQKLQNVCRHLIGLDVDKKAIRQLKKFDIKNIFYGDIVKGKCNIKLKTKKFDYIILGDIIEHLDNPGSALNNVKKLMNRKTRLLLTTPNVFSYRNIKGFIFGRENVHPDHTFWPSYKTMIKLFSMSDLEMEDFSYCFWGSSNEATLKSSIAYKLFLRMRRYLLPCMFFVLRKR